MNNGQPKPSFLLRKDILLYIVIIASLLIIALFIYPTPYKFDKLDQKTPVKINRLTGNTQILTNGGWSDVSDPSGTEIEKLRSDLFAALSKDRESLKSSVIDSVKADLDQIKLQTIQSIKNDIDTAKSDIAQYKQNELDPDNYFTVGSTVDEVKKIMGPPTSTDHSEFFGEDTWYYGNSTVTFKNGKVTKYSSSQFSNKLRVR